MGVEAIEAGDFRDPDSAAKISEAKDPKISEAKDPKISEAKDFKISAAKDPKISANGTKGMVVEDEADTTDPPAGHPPVEHSSQLRISNTPQTIIPKGGTTQRVPTRRTGVIHTMRGT